MHTTLRRSCRYEDVSTSSPLAYLITFTTFGSWLHGDPRGSRARNEPTFPTLPIAPNAALEAAERRAMQQPAIRLCAKARDITERVLRDVCVYKGWTLHAVHARPTHVHVIVSASVPVSDVLRVLKAWASRRLAEAGLVPHGTRVWTRHASTVYLWTPESCDRAVHYVVHEQDRDGTHETAG
jgi:REP element-mobilizing transposase RayT